ATREAAAALALGRKTVATAYEMLETRGLVDAHVGQGTFVTARSAGGPVLGGTSIAPRHPPRAFAWPALFARSSGRRLRNVIRHLDGDGAHRFDFRGGFVDAPTLPASELRWAFGRPFQARARLAEIAAHRDPYGWPPLRREIARHLASRGIACGAAEV